MHVDRKGVTDQARKPKMATFFGMNDAGFAMLEYKSKKFFGAGVVCESKGSKIVRGKRVPVWMRRASTPNYQPNPKTEKSIRCICNATGRVRLFKGNLVRVVADAQIEKQRGAAKPARAKRALPEQTSPDRSEVCEGNKNHVHPPTSSEMAVRVVPILQTSVVTSTHDGKHAVTSAKSRLRQKRGMADMLDLQAELAALGAAREAGFDPNLKIRHLVALSQDAVPTLYRKMANRLCPKPTKRGRSSFWKLSEVEAYITGTWVAPDAESAR